MAFMTSRLVTNIDAIVDHVYYGPNVIVFSVIKGLRPYYKNFFRHKHVFFDLLLSPFCSGENSRNDNYAKI